MGKQVTLGGDRLGSGNKNKQELNNYYRSTHNLSQKFISSMGCGMLYPFLVLPAMRGDSFEIDLYADARTIPTQGALFGSFKMQIDLFQCPIRLYQAILHNNPTAIGLKMNQVKFPQLILDSNNVNINDDVKLSNSCLLKYLGLSGLGTASQATMKRKINAIPMLAYYDIFKNYYSNKQETNAYCIGAGIQKEYISLPIKIESFINNNDPEHKAYYTRLKYNKWYNLGIFDDTEGSTTTILFRFENITNNDLLTLLTKKFIYIGNEEGFGAGTTESLESLSLYQGVNLTLSEQGFVININNTVFYADWNSETDLNPEYWSFWNENPSGQTTNIQPLLFERETTGYTINEFNLQNLDLMREKLLCHSDLGTPFKIGNSNNDDWNTTTGEGSDGLPYSAVFGLDTNGNPLSQNPLQGLMLKTYQSDLYNNWIKTDWIDGENGIAAITAISTSSGSFTMDALNLAEKLYNMLNRIAVSGNTYEDWQDAVYTQSPRRHIESPVFLGGMSSEIKFEEIVQTAPTELEGGKQALGTLGGRGIHIKNKGGHVVVKVDEASFIMGIVSLTPRIVYTQGNEWYLTDLESMDDFHKPALDGIGYEDLIGERLAYWNTIIDGSGNIVSRSKIGKVPAWINYMTAVDKAYGDFAETDGYGYMVLNRNYEKGTNAGEIKDATTYIDPSKYNYAFAYTDLTAQNFWVEIFSDIKARRLMSAKQIPNI